MNESDRGPHDPASLQPEARETFSPAAREHVHAAMRLRRDIRHFQPDRELDAALLERILEAADRAPSVGLSQPWSFILVRDRALRAQIRESFLRVRALEAARFTPERRALYERHRLEGILDASLNVCVTCDLRTRAEPILGTTAQPESLWASVGCAVQNLWLAARVEGVGVGWVSIVEPKVLSEALALPEGVVPLAYLCLGYPLAFRNAPMLEETGWQRRRELRARIHPHGVWRELSERDAGELRQPPALGLHDLGHGIAHE